jgi:multidrug transporter EmrE-like cation transporter
MRVAFFVAIVVLSGTFGEILITMGMKQAGEPERLRPRPVLRFLGRALRNGCFWTAIPLLALSFYAMLALLSWAPVSFVVPATALSYAVGALGGRFLLGERVDLARWTGVVLVCVGVALAWAG